MVNFFVFEALGSSDKINECRYALLKYLEVYNLNPPSSIGVIIYTDRPAFFEAYLSFFDQFELKEVSQNELKEWKGKNNFDRRIKIKVIKEVFEHLQGNVLLCDNTTYIKEPIEGIFEDINNGSFVLYAPFKASLEKQKLDKFLSTATIDLEENLQPLTVLWSTSVIGINSNSKKILDEVLSIADAVYEQFPKNITEPYAFTYVLDKKGTIKEARQRIYRYHNLKEFQHLLKIFFKKNEEESIPNLVKLVHHLDAATIQKHKNDYEALPFYKKWLNTLTGKAWNIEQYRKKI